MEKKHLALWCGPCSTHRQDRELISGPNLDTGARLLSFNRTQSTVVIGLLTEHNTLRRHLHIMGLSNNPICRKCDRAHLKRDGTWAETRFGLSEKWKGPFISVWESVQLTAGSRGVRISGQTMDKPCLEAQCKSSGYPLQSPISLSLPLPRVTVCHHVSNSLYWGGNLSPHLCECEALASLRRTYLGSFFLDPEDIRVLGMGTIWNFAKGTELL